MNTPISALPALLIVKRPYFDQFAAGMKTIEYRLHRPPFTRRVFYPGREVRIAYNYKLDRFPWLLARVLGFDVALARDHPTMLDVYPALRPSDEVVLIALTLVNK